MIDMILLWIKAIFYFIYCYFIAFVQVFKPPSRKSIAGEIALVTGAGHGIGRELALHLSQLGATVVVWDVNKGNNEKTAEEINRNGGNAFAYVCDVTNTKHIAEVAAKVRKDVGEVNVLVNNAGVINGAFIQDLDERAIKRTFEVNVLSHFWMDKEFLPAMKAKNHGHILNIVSMAAFIGAETLTDYVASKHAALGLSNSLRIELRIQGYHGIKISSVCPMIVDTGFLKNFECKLSPLLSPEEVAKAAIDGMLRNYEVITVPWDMYYSVILTKLLPAKALRFSQKFGFVKVSPQYKKGN